MTQWFWRSTLVTGFGVRRSEALGVVREVEISCTLRRWSIDRSLESETKDMNYIKCYMTAIEMRSYPHPLCV